MLSKSLILTESWLIYYETFLPFVRVSLGNINKSLDEPDKFLYSISFMLPIFRFEICSKREKRIPQQM